MPCWAIVLLTALAGFPAGVAGAWLAAHLPRDRSEAERRVGPRWLTPAMALATAAGFAVMATRFGPVPVLPAYCYLIAVTVPLAVIDTRCRRLPDELTLPSYLAAAVLFVIAALWTPHGFGHVIAAVITAAGTVVLYRLLETISGGAIGHGDVKLSGVLGLYLGWLGPRAAVLGIFAGFLLAAAVALPLLLTGRSKRSSLPFGPFMIAGTIAIILSSAAV